MNIFSELLCDRPVAYHPLLARACGGVKVAIWLSQLGYWHGKGHNSEGWIHKTDEEFEAETALTPKEQRRIRAAALRLGIVAIERRGVPARLHYRLDLDRVLQLLPKVITGCAQRSELVVTDGHNLPISVSESTTESTHTLSKNRSQSGQRGRQIQIPADFRLTPADRAYAQEQGLGEVDRVLADFRSYYEAKGTRWKDWHLVWLRWCRQQKEYRRAAAGEQRPAPYYPTIDEIEARSSRKAPPPGGNGVQARLGRQT